MPSVVAGKMSVSVIATVKEFELGQQAARLVGELGKLNSSVG